MKDVLQKVYSLLKRVFFFLHLNVRVEAGLRDSSNNEDKKRSVSDDPDLKEQRKENNHD